MESTSSRLILAGTAYDYLFPKPLYKDETIKGSADVSDTVTFIQGLIPKTLSDTRKLVEELLWEKELKKFCSKAWHFAYHHIPYKRDEDGVEQVRRPARAWADRHKGGIDCDCYSVFLGSCLFNAGIKFHLRITKYPKKAPETPYWQHIYLVVPKDQNPGYTINNRDDYWVLDCVKDRFNSEEPYLEFKDYPMRLDYLNGLDSEKQYRVPQNVDAQDLASTNDIDELGELGQWLQTEDLGRGPKKTKAERKVKRKQFFKKGFRVFNRFLNPATVALRNSVLLAMKVNFLKIASKIRYGYFSDAQAKQKGLHAEKFSHLKKIKEKVEKIYEKAGGKKENFRKAILKGHGNKDKAVPMNGLEGGEELFGDPEDDENMILDAQGIEGLEEVYGLGDLGAVTLAAGLAASTAILTPIAAALSKVKGMFPKNAGAQGKEFDSEQDASGAAPASMTSNLFSTLKSSVNTALPQKLQTSYTGHNMPIIKGSMKYDLPAEQEQADEGEQEDTSLSAATNRKAKKVAPPQELDTTIQKDNAQEPNGFGKAVDFAKKNLAVTALLAGALSFGLYKLATLKKAATGLSGFSSKRKKNRKGKGKSKAPSKRKRVTHKKILSVKLR